MAHEFVQRMQTPAFALSVESPVLSAKSAKTTLERASLRTAPRNARPSALERDCASFADVLCFLARDLEECSPLGTYLDADLLLWLNADVVSQAAAAIARDPTATANIFDTCVTARRFRSRVYIHVKTPVCATASPAAMRPSNPALTQSAADLRLFVAHAVGPTALCHASFTVSLEEFDYTNTREQFAFNLWDLGVRIVPNALFECVPSICTHSPPGVVTCHSESFVRHVLAIAKSLAQDRGCSAASVWCAASLSLKALVFSALYVTDLVSMYGDDDDTPAIHIVQLARFVRTRTVIVHIESDWCLAHGMFNESALLADNAEHIAHCDRAAPAWCAELFYNIFIKHGGGAALSGTFVFSNHALALATHVLLAKTLPPSMLRSVEPLGQDRFVVSLDAHVAG